MSHSVRMISIQKPVIEELDNDSAEQLLAFCARVSNTANQLNFTTGPKLIRSLIRRQEWSPLQMVFACFEVRTTRDISRQILRHPTIHPQEFSQRYSVVDNQPIFSEARLQHPTDRQASVECEDSYLQQVWQDRQSLVWNTAISHYNAALQDGIAKELARKLLPEGLTPTLLYLNAPIRTWLHYCMLRSKPSTQKEHRLIAQEIWAKLIKELPSLAETIASVRDTEDALFQLKSYGKK